MHIHRIVMMAMMTAVAAAAVAAGPDAVLLERGKLAGGQVFKEPWGECISRNLTPHPTGLKDWSDALIIKAVREGVGRDGKPYRPPMGFDFYKGISDNDMGALVAYLRSLKPQAFAGSK